MLAERLNESEALKLVATMLATYRGGDDPEPVVKALAGRLMVEPRCIAIACCDPVHGLKREIFLKPEVADIARWCERESEAISQMVRDDIAARRREEEDRKIRFEQAAAADRSSRPTIEELRARHGPTFGLKGIDKLDRARGTGGNADDTDEALRRAEQANRKAFEVSNAAIAGTYAELGVEPRRAGWGDMLVSPSLMASLGKPIKCKPSKQKRAAK